MGDLQVDASALEALTHAMTPLTPSVRMDRALADGREDVLGSGEVAGALGSAGATITTRGEVLAQSLTAIGQYPFEVAVQITATEGDLAAQVGH